MINLNNMVLPQQHELLFTSTKQKDWAFDHGITTTRKETSLFPQTCNSHDTNDIECLINLPSLQELPNPLTNINTWNHQLNNPWLLKHNNCNHLDSQSNNQQSEYHMLQGNNQSTGPTLEDICSSRAGITSNQMVSLSVWIPRITMSIWQNRHEMLPSWSVYTIDVNSIGALITAACSRTMEDHTAI